MKGIIKATVAGLCLGTGLATLVGCTTYRSVVDPCWPDRYNAEARQSVRDTFVAQVHNGHILDQTVWDYHFEMDPKTGEPTDKLNPAGMEHLRYLARRGPAPDPHLFLQTAHSVAGAAAAPDKAAQARAELDNRRVASIQRYMASVMTGRAHAVTFEVAVHDPADTGIAATPIGGSGSLKNPVVKGAIPLLNETFKGKMAGVEGVTITTSGGS